MTLLPYIYMNFYEVEELSDTKRGDGGFGSTGEK
jgi:dUTPase